tara:strand:+ start:468 stop:1853 length:1386 start_codon:yes stop_codon:yes gene_type:complete
LNKFKFIDLFAGLGGFHYALDALGGECVFVSEIDQNLQKLYIKNHKINPSIVHGDISKCINKVPPHDILVAGFPCQPFSKSGKQLGFDDKNRGDCIFYAIDILERLRPKFFIFENVSNFAKHNNLQTWREIKLILKKLGYCVRSTADLIENGKFSQKPISPHQFGYPQKRERFFAVGSLDYIPRNPFPITNDIKPSLINFLDKDQEIENIHDPLFDIEKCKIGSQGTKAINLWNEFIKCLPNFHKDLPSSFPLWLEECFASYSYATQTPYQCFIEKGYSEEEIDEKLNDLPPYAREKVSQFPLWKIKFIDHNREWFKKYANYIDQSIVQEIRSLDYTYRKLEWNYKNSLSSDIWKHTIQLRPSGLRISNPSYVPTIVSMNSNQRPIYGPLKRYLTTREISRVFGFPSSFLLSGNHNADVKALGNAVHTQVVKLIAKNLISYGNLRKLNNLNNLNLNHRVSA